MYHHSSSFILYYYICFVQLTVHSCLCEAMFSLSSTAYWLETSTRYLRCVTVLQFNQLRYCLRYYGTIQTIDYDYDYDYRLSIQYQVTIFPKTRIKTCYVTRCFVKLSGTVCCKFTKHLSESESECVWQRLFPYW